MTLDERKALRRKALWRVSDFADYIGVSPERARRALIRYNAELGGLLLRPTKGENRGYTFYWASLAKHDPDAFLDDPIETQGRVDALEDLVGEMRHAQRIVASQTGQNTRDIAKLRTGRKRAA